MTSEIKRSHRPRYTNEFKRLVIHKLLLAEGESIRRLAVDLGIAKSTVWDWQQEIVKAMAMSDSKKAPPTRDPADVKRIRQLEKELKEAHALLELQKKAREIWGDDEDDDTKPTND
jgi:transposase-like protein